MATITTSSIIESFTSSSINSKPLTGDHHFRTPSSVSFHRRLNISASAAATATATATTRSSSLSTASDSSLYEVLGVRMGATCQELKAAYRTLAKSVHPDVAVSKCSSGDQEEASGEYAFEFIRVREAYETLSDPKKRADYDRSLVFSRGGRQMRSSSTVMSASACNSTPSSVASTFTTRRRWETDQCW